MDLRCNSCGCRIVDTFTYTIQNIYFFLLNLRAKLISLFFSWFSDWKTVRMYGIFFFKFGFGFRWIGFGIPALMVWDWRVGGGETMLRSFYQPVSVSWHLPNFSFFGKSVQSNGFRNIYWDLKQKAIGGEMKVTVKLAQKNESEFRIKCLAIHWAATGHD